MFHGCPSLAVPGSELWSGSVELWDAADPNRRWEQVKHIPSPCSPGSALSGSCLTWKELFVCSPRAVGTRLDRGRSGAADPGERRRFGSR